MDYAGRDPDFLKLGMHLRAVCLDSNLLIAAADFAFDVFHNVFVSTFR